MNQNVFLRDNWTTNSVSIPPDGSIFNDVWGFSINNRDYAAIGSTDGIHILEIGTDLKFVERAFVPGASSGANVVNRDFCDFNGYLYAVCDDGYATLQIIDLHYLPDSVHVVYDTNQFIQRAHTVFVDSSRSKLYVAGPRSLINGDRPLDVFSLVDPENPIYEGSFNYVDYVHDGFVRNDTAWLNCGDEGLVVVDFSNTAIPIIIGSLDVYPDLGYNHSGYLSEDGKKYVFTDENPGKKIKYCDVSDLNDIQVLNLFNSGSDAQTIAHNPILLNNYVYVSHYYDGLQIFDVSNPNVTERVGWYDTHEEDEAIYSGAWGVYVFNKNGRILVSDRQSGLFLFEFNAPPRINNDLEFGMYANPCDQFTWFYSMESKNTGYEISIYSNSGQLIFNDQFYGNNYFLITSDFTSGVYHYRVNGIDIDKSMQGKFVVVHQ